LSEAKGLSMSKVTVEFINREACVDGFGWVGKFRVTHVPMDIRFVVEMSPGRCCGFNMMAGVPRCLWGASTGEENDTVWEEIRQELEKVFYKQDHGFVCAERPFFKVSQLFYTQNSTLAVHPRFKPVLTWQSASEPGHTTTMYQIDICKS